MGLDIYAGSLTRYYARDWETVIQKHGRETGMPMKVIRVNEPDDAVPDPDEIHETIMQWREWMSKKLAEEGEPPLDWNERLDAPYETDKPDWIGYGSLLVWAAREEHPRWFTQKSMGDAWDKDRSYRRSVRKGSKSRYSQLVMGPELWLPADFHGVIDAIGPTGTEMRIGSLGQLRAQLDLLNERTWQADAATVQSWSVRGPTPNGSVEELAQFGYAVFDRLARYAIKQRVVLVLDY